MRLNLEAVLENLKTKIDALGDAARSKDPVRFFTITAKIQTLLLEMSQQLGEKVPGWPKVTTKQFLSGSYYPISAKTDQEISKLFLKIEELYLSVRAMNCFKRLNINYIGDLVQKKESDLLKVPNFGRKTLREIKQELSQMGLHLGMQIIGWPPDNVEKEKRLRSLAQNLEQKPQNQAAQNHQASFHSEPIEFKQKTFINLLRKVDEFELSVRARNRLKDIKIIFIGDLVHKKITELLRAPNFGWKSFLEIKKILNQMNLDFGMNVLGWPPKNIEKALENFSTDLEQLRIKGELKLRRNFEIEIEYLEDELSHLASLVGKHRDAQILIKHFGWDGQKPRTLEAVGKHFDITRERVRQICIKFDRKVKWKKGRKALYLPILDSALQFVADLLPADYSYIQSELAKRGITRGIFRAEGLLTAAEILNQKAPFCLVTLGGKRFAIKPEAIKEPKLILQLAKKSIEHWGVATFSDIAARVAEKTNLPINRGFVKMVLSSLKSFHFLDESGGWFWISSTARNRLLNQVKKVLSVSGRIDVAELRTGIGRHHRMEGFSPPRRVLLEFCRQIPWCRVEGNMVIADPPLNWEEMLAGSNEWAMAAILKEHGPVMTRMKLEEMCLDLGMNQHSFYIYLASSPIITKYAIGVYGLRGAKVNPGVIKSLRPKAKHKRVLLDFGWTHDGKVWICLEISQANINTGVFNIPAAMQKFIQGNFDLRTADGAYLGDLKVANNSGWSLNTFFRRRGGEPGDYLVLTFDVSSREAIVFIGDESLLDIFRPED